MASREQSERGAFGMPDARPRLMRFMASQFAGRYAICSALGFISVAAGLGSDAAAAPPAQQLQKPACDGWTSDYALAARLRLDDTPFGAGNGVYDVGPGLVRLRFSKTVDPAALKVEMLGYDMRERFVVESSVLFIHAKVTTRTETHGTADEHGVMAVGTLRGREITWSTPVRGYHSDGTIHCEGSGCGFSGVPPSGTSALHIPAAPVRFSSFVFDSPNLGTLRMAETRVAHTDMPRQTAFITFSGRLQAPQCARGE